MGCDVGIFGMALGFYWVLHPFSDNQGKSPRSLKHRSEKTTLIADDAARIFCVLECGLAFRARIMYDAETTTVLTFKKGSVDAKENSPLLFCKDEKDSKVNVFYRLKGTWIFYTEPTLFWLDPPREDYKIQGYVRTFVSCDPSDKEELVIRPPHTAENLEGPAHVTADISMPQELILYIA
jgi:hypothetical protein